MKTLLLVCSLPIAVLSWAQNNVSEPFSSQQIIELAHPNLDRSLRTGRDQYHQLDSTKTHAFDDQLGAWVFSESTSYAYYATGGIYSEMHMDHHISQEVSIFKETGEIDYSVSKIWNGSSYEEELKTVYHYSPQSIPTIDSLYVFSAGKWEPTGYYQYVFDSAGNLSEKWRYQDVSGVTYPVSKFVFLYDTQGKVIDLKSYYYSFSTWKSQYHYYYEYDGYGREDLFTCEVWKQNSYEKVFQAESIYSVHNLLSYKIYDWESTGWVNRNTTTLEYDVSISSISILLPHEYRGNGHKIIGKSSRVNYQGQWAPNDSVSFYYSGPEPNGAEELSENREFKILGNPVRENLRILNANLESVDVYLYDNTGALVMTHVSSDEIIQIAGESLKSGFYYAKIMHADQMKVLPFIKN